jgi:hypothetical protein
MMQKSKRTYSKRLVALNIALCWVVIFYAIYAGLADVAVAGLAIIATIIGAYVGVGHMDFRSVLNAMKGTVDYGFGDNNINIDTTGQDQ